MTTPFAGVRWQRVAHAAARLAALYAAGVVLLLLAFTALLNGLPRTLSDLPGITVPIAVLFSLAFAILAVARRAGFVVLWFCMIGLWVWMLIQVFGYSPLSIPMRFVGWSVLAVCLVGAALLSIATIIIPP